MRAKCVLVVLAAVVSTTYGAEVSDGLFVSTLDNGGLGESGTAKRLRGNARNLQDSIDALTSTVGPCSEVEAHFISAEKGPKYTCGDSADQSGTWVFYPKPSAGTSYPVVMFHHGSAGYPNLGYKDMMTKVSEHCLVVIAPSTPRMTTSADCKSDHDLEVAYQFFSNTGKARVPGANFGRIGLMGHSAGAHHIPTLIPRTNMPVKAVALSHGGKDLVDTKISPTPSTLYKIPSFFMSGEIDRKVHSADVTHWYSKAESTHKVFLNVRGANHHEPHTTGKANVWFGRFLACHLSLDKDLKHKACVTLYDSSRTDHICNYDKTIYAPTEDNKSGCKYAGSVP